MNCASRPAWLGKWLGGLYYYDLNSHGIFLRRFRPARSARQHRRRQSPARRCLFGEAIFDVSESLRITVGGRYQGTTASGRFFGEGLAPYDYDRASASTKLASSTRALR